MALTNEDLQAIANLLKEEVEPLKKDIKDMQENIEDMQENIKDMQENIEDMQENIEDMQENIENMQENIEDMQENIKDMQENIKDTQESIKDIQLTLETETNRNIKIIAEGHTDLNKKLDDVLKVESEKEMLLIRVNHLENELRKIKEKLNQIA